MRRDTRGVFDLQGHEFGHPEARDEAGVQHCAVANPQPRARTWDVDDGLDLLDRQTAHELDLGPLGRDSEDATHLIQRGRHSVLHESHEGLDRGEPRVPRGSSILALALEVLEEAEHQARIDLLESQSRRRGPKSGGGILKKQAEAMRVRFARMHAGPPFNWQPLSQVGSHVRRERSRHPHSLWSRARDSHASAT
jgi:hypothetical protein